MLCQNLERYDPKAVRPPTLKELEKYQEGEAGPGPAIQAHRKGLVLNEVEQQDAQVE